MTQIASQLISLKLPVQLVQRVREAARQQAISPADFIRAAIGAALVDAQTPLDERLRMDPCLQGVFRQADGWTDLQNQLRERGLMLHHDGGGQLALRSFPAHDFLCKLDVLDLDARELAERYGKPFPGLEAPEPHPVLDQTRQRATAPTAPEAAQDVASSAREAIQELAQADHPQADTVTGAAPTTLTPDLSKDMDMDGTDTLPAFQSCRSAPAAPAPPEPPADIPVFRTRRLVA
ncbi:hypothetical protein ERN12_09175 [Rhodobacteraceae bacterium]|nr:hypothetical protein ERN12_09175 [Paracoccaceae bacterium]